MQINHTWDIIKQTNHTWILLCKHIILRYYYANKSYLDINMEKVLLGRFNLSLSNFLNFRYVNFQNTWCFARNFKDDLILSKNNFLDDLISLILADKSKLSKLCEDFAMKLWLMNKFKVWIALNAIHLQLQENLFNAYLSILSYLLNLTKRS